MEFKRIFYYIIIIFFLFFLFSHIFKNPIPLTTNDIDPYLQIPTVVQHPNNKFLKPYSAIRKGLKVRYIKQIFDSNQPPLVFIPKTHSGKIFLPWQTSYNNKPGLIQLYPNMILKCLDNNLYDFGLGTLFVKVQVLSNKAIGYMLLTSFIGETEPVNFDLWSAKDRDKIINTTTIDFNGIKLYTPQLLSNDLQLVNHYIEIMNNPQKHINELNAGGKSIHPLLSASIAYSLLLYSISNDVNLDFRNKIIDSIKNFFNYYVIPNKVQFPHNSISWPYDLPWMLNWGIKLNDHWYSSFPNALFSAASALLYRLTNDIKYKILAQESINFLSLSIKKGGGQYNISGFKLPAEYIYNTPPLPNVRILDGELFTTTAIYNTARLLNDSSILRLFMQYSFSLAMQLNFYQSEDGSLLFASYFEKMPGSYKWLVWSDLQVLANITKDKRFLMYAKKLRPNIPKELIIQNGG